MQTAKRWLVLLFVVGALLAPLGRAMNMPSYDVVSLVYMSTDIVIADLSEDPDKKFTATVTETLYGTVQPGEKLSTLTTFLTFFSPMKDGMKVVLFLDRRPHQYNFLFSDLAHSPFAIPPSGVLLIDQYEHVHHYYQMNNPGPYVAEGWWSFPKPAEPTKKVDLKLPSLDEEKVKIAIAVREVATVRPLLDRKATNADAPELLKLLDRTSPSTENCDLRMATAITEKATEQIRSLNDPELLLEAHVRAGDEDSFFAAEGFINPPGDSENMDEETREKFATTRAQFLIKILEHSTEDRNLRMVAARFLLLISAWNHPGGGIAKVLPINAKVLVESAGELRKVSQRIFDDEQEDGNLRGICLEFLLDQPGIFDDARKVHAHTHSNLLRFMIEELLIGISDEDFHSLGSASGEAASIVSAANVCGCMASNFSGAEFVATYRRTGTLASGVEFMPVLSNLKTGQRFVMKVYETQGSSSSSNGTGWVQFRLSHLDAVSTGDYTIALEFIEEGKTISRGYPAKVTIRNSPEGEQVVIDQGVSGSPPVGWVD